MKLEKLIQAQSFASTRDKWRNDFNSFEYKFCSDLNYELFGISFNKKQNCGCVDDFFLLLKKKILNFKKMENKFFKLKEGVAYQNPKFGFITNNTSDEVHSELLLKYPVLAKHYTHMDQEGFKKAQKQAKEPAQKQAKEPAQKQAKEPAQKQAKEPEVKEEEGTKNTDTGKNEPIQE